MARGGYSSIDSHLLLTALRFGWMPAVLTMVGLLVYSFRAVIQRSSPVRIVLLSLIPAYGTVAFITQIGTIVRFIVGMATSAQVSVLLESRNRTTGEGVGVVAGRTDPWNQVHSGDWVRRAFIGRSIRPTGSPGTGSH